MVSIGLALGAGGLNRLIRQQKESKDAAAKEAELLRKQLAERADFMFKEKYKADIREATKLDERKYQEGITRMKETVSLVPPNVLGYNDEGSEFVHFRVNPTLGADERLAKVFAFADSAIASDPEGFAKLIMSNKNASKHFQNTIKSFYPWYSNYQRQGNTQTTSVPLIDGMLKNSYKIPGFKKWMDQPLTSHLKETLGTNKNVDDITIGKTTLGDKEIDEAIITVTDENKNIQQVTASSRKVKNLFPRLLIQDSGPDDKGVNRKFANWIYSPKTPEGLENDIFNKEVVPILESMSFENFFNSGVTTLSQNVTYTQTGPDGTPWSNSDPGSPVAKSLQEGGASGYQATIDIKRLGNSIMKMQLDAYSRGIPVGNAVQALGEIVYGITGDTGFLDQLGTWLGKTVISPLSNGYYTSNYYDFDKLTTVEANGIQAIPERYRHQGMIRKSSNATTDDKGRDYGTKQEEGTKGWSKKVKLNATQYTNNVVEKAGEEADNGELIYNRLNVLEKQKAIAKMNAYAKANNVDIGIARQKYYADLAAIRTMQVLLAYRVAVMVQGGKGGRTVSDFDFANALRAIGADAKITTLEASVAKLKTVIGDAARQAPRLYVHAVHGNKPYGNYLTPLADDVGHYLEKKVMGRSKDAPFIVPGVDDTIDSDKLLLKDDSTPKPTDDSGFME
jgi:hypothetical protein|tara:strand:+ start:1147 stop:3177 length:2031 start_codon:yes stop_codon:yes gene_type:complete